MFCAVRSFDSESDSDISPLSTVSLGVLIQKAIPPLTYAVQSFKTEERGFDSDRSMCPRVSVCSRI